MMVETKLLSTTSKLSLALLFAVCWHMVAAKPFVADKLSSCECGISSASVVNGNLENPTEQAGQGFEHIFHGAELDNATALPWMATMQARFSQRQRAFCTATIVGPRHILTAAHCDPARFEQALQTQYPNETFTFFVGVGSTNDRDAKLVEIKPEQIQRHPKTRFTPAQIFRDLLLIEVPEALDFSDPKLKPICLSGKQPPQDWMALVAGWGWTRPLCEQGAYLTHPNDLRIGRVLVPNSHSAKCGVDYFNDPRDEDRICTVPIPGAPQRGDSGGPLLVNDGEKWSQIGVASMVSGCDGSEPTDLSKFIALYARIDCDWIKQASTGAVQCVD